MKTVIGLEIHAQLLTQTKLFCACRATYFGAPPNAQTCPVCLGMPGALPTLNQQAVELALRAALALNCDIPRRSTFARKNYFYPDLPKGYQISQYDEPLAVKGFLDLELPDGSRKRIRIRRVHLEEDAGKSIHLEDGRSLVDLNRAGVPLIEMVTEPDLASPEEAKCFMEELRRMVRYIEVCSGDMEEGSLRCDANISVSLDGQLGTKTEIKNMNSFRAVEEALRYEEERQRQELRAGRAIAQQTLLWNPNAQRVESMRAKEESEDYRYFPEPDLVPLQIEGIWEKKVEAQLPELPAARRRRFREALHLPDYDARLLTEERHIADYFEAALAVYANAKEGSNWLLSELLPLLRDKSNQLTPIGFATILQMVDRRQLTRLSAKEVLAEAAKTGKHPTKIVETQGLAQISDVTALAAVVAEVVRDHARQVDEFRAGKEAVVQFLIGQVMKRTKGRADPARVLELMRQQLGAPNPRST